jgi:hypothetical protein
VRFCTASPDGTNGMYTQVSTIPTQRREIMRQKILRGSIGRRSELGDYPPSHSEFPTSAAAIAFVSWCGVCNRRVPSTGRLHPPARRPAAGVHPSHVQGGSRSYRPHCDRMENGSSVNPLPVRKRAAQSKLSAPMTLSFMNIPLRLTYALACLSCGLAMMNRAGPIGRQGCAYDANLPH